MLRDRADINICRDLITRGSKSFSLAARLFDRRTRDDAFCLYGWCRTCDDAIDGSELGFKTGDTPTDLPVFETLGRLEALKARTSAAFRGERPDDRMPSAAVFRAFGEVVRRRGVPQEYALELLEGMGMDVRRQRYQSIDDLHLYCYRVAGTVGLMMSHIMGLRDEQALRHAADLGMAMQLTNIARDVAEDHAAGRLYLPLDWLDHAGIPADRLLEPVFRGSLASVVRRLLTEANHLYASGDAGLFALRFKAACAVGAARRVYSEIGRRVENRGGRAWETRTVVPASRKAAMAAVGVATALRQLPRRWLTPWHSAPIRSIWNPFSEVEKN
jgi:phytoene synthase